MKRCPLCDFIYEDDQGVCDMDGFELVHERGALVPVGGETRPGRLASARSRHRRRSARLLLGFGLGAAVFSAYYMSVNQAAPTGDGQPPASYADRPTPAATVEPTPAPVAPTPSPTPAEMSVSTTAETAPAPAATPSRPATEPRPATPGGKKARPGNEKKKKESKLSSILNKTGRMLKKPFGF